MRSKLADDRQRKLHGFFRAGQPEGGNVPAPNGAVHRDSLRPGRLQSSVVRLQQCQSWGSALNTSEGPRAVSSSDAQEEGTAAFLVPLIVKINPRTQALRFVLSSSRPVKAPQDAELHENNR